MNCGSKLNFIETSNGHFWKKVDLFCPIILGVNTKVTHFVRRDRWCTYKTSTSMDAGIHVGKPSYRLENLDCASRNNHSTQKTRKVPMPKIVSVWIKIASWHFSAANMISLKFAIFAGHTTMFVRARMPRFLAGFLENKKSDQAKSFPKKKSARHHYDLNFFSFGLATEIAITNASAAILCP